ncbi:class I SAM-dependent methyltransferase [Paenibacillus sp. N3.4]|uniref:class I SAM-dependent methyltransferase n=1 Tax=Paenibacillus sp. N3.4 TaxID=2603222 RepID=UPI0011C8A4DF|nr:class I SAM-dependent methyltransferase [Paenibacillus sp. N3.4]TXK83501.1 class I SAM-dependent methyltransferase [Paenibacillus sp. N3.4]
MDIPNKNALDMWNEQYNQVNEKGLQYNEQESWLNSYLPILQQRGFKNILEIGCGSGNDTKLLASKGFSVTATDFSEVALSIVQTNMPNVQVLHHDTKNKFPYENSRFEVIIAGLSLHYFDENTLSGILNEIRRMLTDHCLFLLRLNSLNDEDAKKEHPIERYFYSVDSCRSLLKGWKEIALGEHAITYYEKKKIIIEGCFEKVGLN